MGYAYYHLPDGREAGYGVEAECDHPGCLTMIDRGLGWLCGEAPMGWHNDELPGCCNYYCEAHLAAHDCVAHQCGAYSLEGEGCDFVEGHDDDHWDKYHDKHWPDSQREDYG